MSRKMKAVEPQSLYLEIGGAAAIQATVDLFYEKVLADSKLKSFFKDTNITRLKKRQVAFFTQALGGPAAYKGPSMSKAHEHLKIRKSHFDRVATHLVSTLGELEVPPRLIDEVIGLVAPLSGEIVNTRTGAKKSTRSKTPKTNRSDKGESDMSNGRFKKKAANRPQEATDWQAKLVDNAPVNVIYADRDLVIQ